MAATARAEATTPDELAEASEAAPAPARPAWQAADPGAVKCVNYLAHRGEHRRFEGRWRCWECFPLGQVAR